MTKPRSRRGRVSSEPLRAQLAQNLRRRRDDLGLSQEEVAVLAEMYQEGYSECERGLKNPRTDTFIRVAGALSSTPGELVAGIAWIPRVRIVEGGSFVTPDSAQLAEEAAELRKEKPGPIAWERLAQ